MILNSLSSRQKKKIQILHCLIFIYFFCDLSIRFISDLNDWVMENNNDFDPAADVAARSLPDVEARQKNDSMSSMRPKRSAAADNS